MKRLSLISLLALLTVGTAACAPKVYVIDRQTMLEEEAAGEWPEFERDLVQKSKAFGPTPFGRVPDSQRRARLTNILNSDQPAAESK